LSAKLRYMFDTGLSRGPSVVIGWLGLLTLIVILVTALLMTLFGLVGVNGGARLGFGEAFWQAMLRVVDAGTFAGDSSWPTRLLGLSITLAGIFLAGSLIGLIANSVDQRVDGLRKGRSSVLETGHTLILGYSSRVPVIVSELVLANESLRRGVVVVLANEDKSVMEDELRDQVSNFLTTRLVCRRGHTDQPADLELVNVAGAKSIIVVGESDATVIKTLLAVRSIDPNFDNAHLVVETRSEVTVNSDQIVAELTAQACRQRGLSSVFRELLDFDGDEVYFEKFPDTVGKTFAQAQLAFESSALMGRLTADGIVELNPPADTVLQDGDELIGIASDDSTFLCGSFIEAPEIPQVDNVAAEAGPTRILVVGWSVVGPRVLAELDEFLTSDTVIEIIADSDQTEVEKILPSISVSNVQIEVAAFSGGPEEVTAYAAQRHFDEVIVLGYREQVSTDEADARTLLTLMAFNHLVERNKLGDVRIVAELLEQRHISLAVATGADDFIVSVELTSLLIAQLSERHELDLVFRDLFDPQGCVLELRPAAAFGAAALKTFSQVVAAASAQNQTALGYRLSENGEVVINPAKSTQIQLGSKDLVLVLR
jgi:voltage-gated potassium channel Kch